MTSFRNLSVGLVTLIGSCGGVQHCANVAPAPPAPVSCEGHISWDGRSPVGVVTVDVSQAQAWLDRGNAVDIGWSGHRHVAGHYSSHGAIFHSGPSLNNGDWVSYDCVNYTVTGRTSSYQGAPLDPPSGLTIQYSGCGGVCLVFAQPS